MGWVSGEDGLFVLPDPGVIDIWQCELRGEDYLNGSLISCLSFDEQKRLDGMLSASGKRQFAITRVFIRNVLAKYLGCLPSDIRFCAGPHGKPGISSVHGCDFSFNLSHAGGCALLAVGRFNEVGVDIEQKRERVNGLAIAERFFSKEEAREIKRAQGIERDVAFHRAWVRKEAFVKATGHGLAFPMSGFQVLVSTVVEEGDCLRAVTARDVDFRDWCVHDVGLNESSKYFAAVSASGKIKCLRCWKYF